MLTTESIIRLIAEAALQTGKEVPSDTLQKLRRFNRSYTYNELEEFKRDVQDAARQSGLILHKLQLSSNAVAPYLTRATENTHFIFSNSGSDTTITLISHTGNRWIKLDASSQSPETAISKFTDVEKALNGLDITEVWSVLILDPLVSAPTESSGPPTPSRRLYNLLLTERKDIIYILIYATFIGLISLVIPLGIQTTVELVSGGVFFSSVYVLIAGIIIAVAVSGGMQVFQLTLVEYLQRRIFAKAAFEFAYRFPHLDARAVEGTYPPGLVNRFLDVLTIQKGLPKFLIEFSAAGLQIIFGLLLLSLYHPFFVFFGLALIAVLTFIFYLTGGRALSTSIKESSYKYKLLHWLEDVARLHHAFKITGTTSIHLTQTDHYLNNYLKNRKSHFRILLAQFTYIVFFKAVIIGGLLIIGTLLVIDREITLGQFVASEVIIILILSSVEKIIMYMDVVYDLLTAVEKVGAVTDLPTERVGGVDFSTTQTTFSIKANGLAVEGLLHDINFSIQPGERICISGSDHIAVERLRETLSGLYGNFKGSILFNDYSLRDLDLAHFRDHIASNGPADEIFEGTVLENIVMGNPKTSTSQVIQVLERTGLRDVVAGWTEGLDTHLCSAGIGLSPLIAHRIMMARGLVRNPGLIFFSDHFAGMSASEKAELMSCALSEKDATLVCFSNDPLFMAACSRILVMESGTIHADGSYPNLLKEGKLKHLLS